MIPTHLLHSLTPATRIAILSRAGEVHFHVHPATDTPDMIRAHARQDGSEVLKTHLQDEGEILAAVAERERDIGGEA